MKTKQILTAITTGAIFLNTLTPLAFADTTLQVAGNGAASTNTVSATTGSTSTVVQNNTSNITNSVVTSANTGNNIANDNTGGSTVIDTGSATQNVALITKANMNQASIGGNGATGNTTVNLSGNGFQSANTATVNGGDTSSVFQTNLANINNTVNTQANTGNNTANANTGGNTSIFTGSASSAVNIQNAANANIASTMGNGSNGNMNAYITGNGAFSVNNIALTDNPSSTVVQGNDAFITNDVMSNNQTGNNTANDNTGGSVRVFSGNAADQVGISNMANFNAAGMDCGCMTTTTANIANNGAFSTNNISALTGDLASIFQGGEGNGNTATISNFVNPNSQTGNNILNANTGSIFGGSSDIALTGNSMSSTSISNATGMNIVGPSMQLPNGTNLNFSFNLGSMLQSLGL